MGCARLGVLWAGGGRWMGGQSKINFAWKRGLSSVYMLLWTDEGGGRSTTNLGHELCGLIHDDVRQRVGRKFGGSFGQNVNFGGFGGRKWISHLWLKRTALTSRP